MKKLLCFILSTIITLLAFSVSADEFSDDANIDYSYNEDYDEIETMDEETSRKYDYINTSYDADYDETADDYFDYGEEIEEPVYKDSNNGYENSTEYDGIKVFVNDNLVEFDVQPMLINDRTMVPMRAIFEVLGAKVSWNNNTQTAKGELDGTTIEIAIGATQMYKNGKAIDLDSPAVIVNNRTLVPVRAIAEGFDCEVNWYGETKVVEILKIVI